MNFLTIKLEKCVFNEIAIKKGPPMADFPRSNGTQAGIEFTEHVADDRAEDHEGSNDNDGNQNQDESILDQTLALFPGGKQHAAHLLSCQDQLTQPFIFVRLL